MTPPDPGPAEDIGTFPLGFSIFFGLSGLKAGGIFAYLIPSSVPPPPVPVL
jgi:hypothetical protein